MSLQDIRKKHRIIDLFVDLAEIPSPTFKEKHLADTIIEIFQIHNINAKKDSYGNVIAKIPATSGQQNTPPILLSAHMDVVGGSEPINISLNGKFIETDKTRTLGADDKAGIAAIMDVAIEMADLYSNLSHGPIEITFTRDEEQSMTGIKNLDTTNLHSRYALILDADKLGTINTSGAGYTNIFIKIHEGKGGHSGIDIADTSRVSAIKVLTELDSIIPQGVVKKDNNGTIASVNCGAILGGSASMFLSETIKELLDEKTKKLPENLTKKEITETTIRKSMTNIIASDACAVYSLRSSDTKVEKQIIDDIKHNIDKLLKKYEHRIKIDVAINKHLKPFEKAEDSTLVNILEQSAIHSNIQTNVEAFHAGAETHIFSNDKLNAKKEKFLPLLIGVANIYNMHSNDEKLDYESLLKGREWLKNTILELAKNEK